MRGKYPSGVARPSLPWHAVQASTVTRQALAALAAVSPGQCLPWLRTHESELSEVLRRPLSMIGVVAAAFVDLGMSPTQGEMLHLIMRLPGAAVHALEQWEGGFKQFPFPAVDLQDDPAQRAGG